MIMRDEGARAQQKKRIYLKWKNRKKPFQIKDTKLDRNDETWALKSDQQVNQKVKMRILSFTPKPTGI